MVIPCHTPMDPTMKFGTYFYGPQTQFVPQHYVASSHHGMSPLAAVPLAATASFVQPTAPSHPYTYDQSNQYYPGINATYFAEPSYHSYPYSSPNDYNPGSYPSTLNTPCNNGMMATAFTSPSIAPKEIGPSIGVSPMASAVFSDAKNKKPVLPDAPRRGSGPPWTPGYLYGSSVGLDTQFHYMPSTMGTTYPQTCSDPSYVCGVPSY
jgi:hypothetical protein